MSSLTSLEEFELKYLEEISCLFEGLVEENDHYKLRLFERPTHRNPADFIEFLHSCVAPIEDEYSEDEDSDEDS